MMQMPRHVVLFAREPARQASEKGFDSSGAADLFGGFALGWLEAARSIRATFVIASPTEDRAGWRRRWVGRAEPILLAQRGWTFGERLERCARAAAHFSGHAVIVGGDVAPDRRCLRSAFEALESGAEAVLAPAGDGGVSLLAVRAEDANLLRAIGRRRRDVFETLRSGLAARGRRVAVVHNLPDVDGRRGIRLLVRRRVLRTDFARVARRMLAAVRFAPDRSLARAICPELPDRIDSRGPPRAA